MSFEAYLENIKAKTGKTPEDFKDIAEKKVLLKSGVTATQIVNWLKKILIWVEVTQWRCILFSRTMVGSR
jgi:hypothetical protein